MNDTRKKLILVDAMALIYRAHYAFINNPRITTKGLNTSAVFGFLNALLEIIEKEKPTHVAVAFDSYEPTLRVVEYCNYKANRDKQPEDITTAIPIIRELLKAFRIHTMEIPGYEADDLIATITKKVPPQDFLVFMFTPDKDYAQLVSENVWLCKPAKKNTGVEIWDEERVKKEFGIKRIDQVVELQGLMGDAVDNIPGIPGIGPKTAQKLIQEYDNIENLIVNSHKLQGNLKEKVQQFAEQALLSKKLATLITDAPVDFEPQEFLLREPDTKALETLFIGLEFRTLGRKILGKEPEKSYPESVDPSVMELITGTIASDESEAEKQNKVLPENANYRQVKDLEEFKHYISIGLEKRLMALHYELNQPDPHSATLRNIALSTGQGDAVYLRFTRDETEASLFIMAMKMLFERREMTLVCFDVKPLLIFLKKQQFDVKATLADLQVMHYVIDPESRHDTDYVCETFLGRRFISPGLLDTADLLKMHCQKADYYLQCYPLLSEKIKASDALGLLTNIELPLISVLSDMESEGVSINPEVLAGYSQELGQEIARMEKDIFSRTGLSFNLNSPQQLGHVLFEILKLDPNAKKTQKTKQYSTSEDVLQKLAEKHPIAESILEYRSLQKLKSTYVDALPTLIKPESGRVHTTFNQTITATGRLSSTNPNLQNIPIRTERGRYIRKAFVARDSRHILLSADYSQIELRIMAHFSKDEKMMAAFRQGYDIHTSTAANIFSVALDDVTQEMRRKAKMVNFGIIYGISSWGLAQRLDIAKSESAEIIDQYFLKFPGIKKFMDETVDLARKQGYVETLFKRRRYIRDINSANAMQRGFAERNAINAPIQGTAADLIKIAMVNIHKEFKKAALLSAMTLQVHDELVFDVAIDELEVVKGIVKDKMENAYPLAVPLTVDIGIGRDWLEAH